MGLYFGSRLHNETFLKLEAPQRRSRVEVGLGRLLPLTRQLLGPSLQLLGTHPVIEVGL